MWQGELEAAHFQAEPEEPEVVLQAALESAAQEAWAWVQAEWVEPEAALQVEPEVEPQAVLESAAQEALELAPVERV